jgi:hypothetical protein
VILRCVANFHYVGACRYTGYENMSIRLELDCGHEVTRKASAGVPGRARCKDCELLASGGTITYGEPDGP